MKTVMPTLVLVLPIGVKYAPNAALATTSNPRPIQCFGTRFARAGFSGVSSTGSEFDMGLLWFTAATDFDHENKIETDTDAVSHSSALAAGYVKVMAGFRVDGFEFQCFLVMSYGLIGPSATG